MAKLNYDRKTIKTRFITNMKRIGAITAFLHSDIEALKLTGFLRSEGVRADIQRSLVVFLHATAEDLIRMFLPKSNKKFTFYKAADFKKHIKYFGGDFHKFKDLFPALEQLAKRRKQIVHHADLQEGQSDGADPWEFSDEWQLIHWNLAVIALHHRLLKVKGPLSVVEERASRNVESALKQNVELANAILAIPKLPAEQRAEGLNKALGISMNMLETLKLSIDMFTEPAVAP